VLPPPAAAKPPGTVNRSGLIEKQKLRDEVAEIARHGDQSIGYDHQR